MTNTKIYKTVKVFAQEQLLTKSEIKDLINLLSERLDKKVALSSLLSVSDLISAYLYIKDIGK